MAKPEYTVRIEPVTNYPALKMIWQHEINPNDLRPIFQEIDAHLKQSGHPVYIIVDLRQNPQFPLIRTVMEALRGPFRNTKLAEWLVISPNPDAYLIAEMLMKAARRNNIRWFEAEDEALTYLETAIADKSDMYFQAG